MRDGASLDETGVISAEEMIMTVYYDYYFFKLKSSHLSVELMWTYATPD
jgi:hypothetical protein